ncbi:MAG: GDSL-type esterase/lipase family protein [bacterium]|nr:GDSL-type esterase/lipase family protein [bacterium]
MSKLPGQTQEQTLDAEARVALPESDDGLPGVGPIRRYDWFRNLWLARRSQWAESVEQDQQAVVFLGDSITQGWGDDLRGSFPELKVANRGISGDTTRGMLIRLDEDVLSLNPQAVVLLMGTNDLEEKATPQQVAENFKLIIERLKSHDPQMPIVACQVFPSSAEKSRDAASIKEVNRLYAQAVYGDPQVTLIDTWTLFANENGDAKLEEFPDLLHPNQLGYDKWASALKPILATLQLIETEAEAFEVESGFQRLFNGEDLSGWCYLPTSAEMLEQRERWRSRAPDAPPWPVVKERIDWDGQQATSDGRYAAISGRLVVTTPPEGRKIQQLWTQREFDKDFTLKLEFRTTPNADSGVFLRGKQLQCRDFPLAGPYQELRHFRSGDWNELVVEVRGNRARCTCNGEVLEEAFELPDNGPIGLEGDRGQIEYRRIRISE